MAVITRFEDLQVWISSRILTRKVYQIKKTGPFSRDYGLRDQIRRAAVSTMSNIAEGFDSNTRALFISYLGRARASIGEIRCQLYIALDLEYITELQFRDLEKNARDCSCQLFGFIKYLRSQPNSNRIR
jgi:four helix bundle protein